MTGLKSLLPLPRGRCEACRWNPLCGGSFRARAEKLCGDIWMHDPACYLTDEEMRKDFSASTDNLAAILLWKKGCVK